MAAIDPRLEHPRFSSFVLECLASGQGDQLTLIRYFTGQMKDKEALSEASVGRCLECLWERVEEREYLVAFRALSGLYPGLSLAFHEGRGRAGLDCHKFLRFYQEAEDDRLGEVVFCYLENAEFMVRQESRAWLEQSS